MVSDKSIEQVNSDWALFLEAHNRKDRESRNLMNQNLQKRIAQLKILDSKAHKEYSETLLWLYFENGSKIPIMNPQLWVELFPYVKEKYELREMPYVLWLYHAFSFQGVYDFLQCNPEDVLRLALKLEPANVKVAQLLYLEHLNMLDFALHELPWGLCVEKKVCLSAIKEAKELKSNYKDLESLKNRFGSSIEMCELVLNDWLIYEQTDRSKAFYDRRKAT